MGVWSKGDDDFKIRHGITCTSCYFPESVFYRAMGRSILSLHYAVSKRLYSMQVHGVGEWAYQEIAGADKTTTMLMWFKSITVNG